MSIGVNNYLLRTQFGENEIILEPNIINYFNIEQNINEFLPSCRISLVDSSGALTHLVPFDKSINTVSVQCGRNLSSEDYNEYQFDVYRRYPEENIYDINGLLTIKDLFNPALTRGLGGTVKDILTSIAIDELKADSVEISSSLDYAKNLVQPNLSNAQFLNYLKENLVGKNNLAGFYCFIKVVDSKKIFVFKTLNELISMGSKYKFIVNSEPVEDYLPIFGYKIWDNYKIFNDLGGSQQTYSYFDYDTGKIISSSVDLTDHISLTDYYLIDANDNSANDFPTLGRSNSFSSNFIGAVKGDFYKRVSGLVKMKVATLGLINIAPGEIVSIIFGKGILSGNMLNYQYSGNWLIERVVHAYKNAHYTYLYLTRNGIDTSFDTTLLKA